MTGAPMLKAAGLWKRTSATGVDYFAGRLGGVKVVILENRERQAENDPTHYLFLAEPTSPAGNSARWHSGARPTQAPNRSPHSTQRRTATASGPALPDYGVNDLWPAL
jgi:hypothetical protein